jgi:hypothetical protein
MTAFYELPYDVFMSIARFLEVVDFVLLTSVGPLSRIALLLRSLTRCPDL